MPETIDFRGPDFDDMRPHLWTFFQAIRSRGTVVVDCSGHHAALASHGERIVLPPKSGVVGRSG